MVKFMRKIYVRIFCIRFKLFSKKINFFVNLEDKWNNLIYNKKL